MIELALLIASSTPSPLVGEGWGEGVMERKINTVARSTVTLSLALSPQGRGNRPYGNEG